jgi:hypothetical protein
MIPIMTQVGFHNLIYDSDLLSESLIMIQVGFHDPNYDPELLSGSQTMTQVRFHDPNCNSGLLPVASSLFSDVFFFGGGRKNPTVE